MLNTIKNKVLLLAIAGMALLSNSCKKDDSTPAGQMSDKEIEEYVETFQELASYSHQIITAARTSASAHDEELDIESIVAEIEKHELIAWAEASESGNCISYHTTDGKSSNILLGRYEGSIPDDAVSMSLPLQNELSKLKQAGQAPNGKKALILSPFQHQKAFAYDLESMKTTLESVGYEVHISTGTQVTPEKYSRDTLEKYSVIFIGTHGSILAKKNGGKSMILTGTEMTVKNVRRYVNKGWDNILKMGEVDGIEYIGVTCDWFEHTKSKAFPNSWIYLDACESSKLKNQSDDTKSFVDYFLNNGVGGFNGFEKKIDALVAINTAPIHLLNFASGMALEDATSQTKQDWELKKMYNANKPTTDIGMFEAFSKSPPFYLYQIDGQGSKPDSLPEPFIEFPFTKCFVKFYSKAYYHGLDKDSVYHFEKIFTFDPPAPISTNAAEGIFKLGMGDVKNRNGIEEKISIHIDYDYFNDNIPYLMIQHMDCHPTETEECECHHFVYMNHNAGDEPGDHPKPIPTVKGNVQIQGDILLNYLDVSNFSKRRDGQLAEIIIDANTNFVVQFQE